jgi:hypothetical protein
MENHKILAELLQNTVVQSSSGNNSSHAFSDADFKELREQIKRIMIPKLIRVFELKLAAQQAATPPSRITGLRPDANKLLEIRTELDKLSEDLKLLHLWCESCQKQVAKASEEVKFSLEKIAPSESI